MIFKSQTSVISIKDSFSSKMMFAEMMLMMLMLPNINNMEHPHDQFGKIN